MRLRPLSDRVAVKYEEPEEETTESGIVLPDTAKEEKPQQGQVVAKGEGCDAEDTPTVEIGDTVVFDKFAGTEVNVDDAEYVILSLEDVLAVIE
ncbi:co-chaperone GroES [Halarsenatibacter silvermanii]|uniref:Co-chaperonin GroES n=1 Tax=Halarsenatibacter silvermanii TaxID=321763 RepID=A0A1G9NEZ6_9FIRM|nr:co-chaperone GroES [Halarsenatibacter silvermanii]SDL85050.1 chaperonin GroES [Halarsenatibacter silvermanii]